MSWRALLSTVFQELRITYCVESPKSFGVKNFFHKNYAELKLLNPRLPIALRSAPKAEAKIIARYTWGIERMVKLDGKSETEVEDALRKLLELKTHPSQEQIPKIPDIVSDFSYEMEHGDERLDEIPPKTDPLTGKLYSSISDFKRRQY